MRSGDRGQTRLLRSFWLQLLRGRDQWFPIVGRGLCYLARREGGSCLGRGIGFTCCGTSRSSIGPTGFPSRTFSTCCGSSGRPGCSRMKRCSSTHGVRIGGGGARVINLGGDVVGKCSTRRAGAGSGPGLNPAAGVRATFTGGAALASIGTVAKRTGRTGGGAMGLPGRTASRVGLMYGCGTTCVLLSRSGGTRATRCATGCRFGKRQPVPRWWRWCGMRSGYC